MDIQNLTAEEAMVEHVKLTDAIRAHDVAYYTHDEPVVSDAEYDRLRQGLLDLETRYPELITPASPSQSVGVTPIKGFGKVRHRVPMLSLDNAFNSEELREFEGKVRSGSHAR